MHLWEFDTSAFGKTVISAKSQLRAIEIYEGETGELHQIPNKLFGNIEFALDKRPPGLTVWMRVKDGCIHAADDADTWARAWPNQVLEFVEMWGEQ